MSVSATAGRRLCLVTTGVLSLSVASTSFGIQPLRAEISMQDLARKIEALEAQNKAMRSEISKLRVGQRRGQAEPGRNGDLLDRCRLPSPLRGGVRGGGPCRASIPALMRTPTPTPAPPRKGEGTAPNASTPNDLTLATAPLRATSAPADETPAMVTADKKMHYGAITITPGGFVALESVFRTRTTQSDVISAFQVTPFANNPLAGTNEARLGARQTRISLLAEGAITPTFLASGYVEIDFLGAGQTANAIEVNGYQLRIRNIYAALDDMNDGWHLLAGQNWSLTTLNSKGITPRNEVIPPTIDGQFVPGFVWTRQAQLRLTKDFGRKLWASVSAEEAQSTFSGGCTTAGPTGGLTPAGGNAGIAGIASINCAGPGTGGGLSSLTNYSLNNIPDVVGKVAYEARVADRDVHVEAHGLYRSFSDRVAYADGAIANRRTDGYSVGAGLIVPLVPKRLDLQMSGAYGRGIGRYGSAQLADTTFNPDGSLKPVREVAALAGLTFHATPSIDLYAFAGIEKSFRAYFQNPDGSYVGLGSPALAAANAGCRIEGSTLCASAPGNSNQIWQVTGGFWDKLYKGAYGEMRAGVQYSYTKRGIFTAPGLASPQTDNHSVLTSLRYYPFQ